MFNLSNVGDFDFLQSNFQVIDKDGNVLETLTSTPPTPAYGDTSTLFPPLKVKSGYAPAIETTGVSSVDDPRVIKNFIRSYDIDKKYEGSTVYIQTKNGIDFQNTVTIKIYSVIGDVKTIEKNINVGSLARNAEYTTIYTLPKIESAEKYYAEIIYEYSTTAGSKDYDGNMFVAIPANSSATVSSFSNIRIRSSLYPTEITIYNNTNKPAVFEAITISDGGIALVWWESISDPPTSGGIRTLLKWNGGQLDYTMAYNNNNAYSVQTLANGLQYKRITGVYIIKTGDLRYINADYSINLANMVISPTTVNKPLTTLKTDLQTHTEAALLMNTDFLDRDRIIGNFDIFVNGTGVFPSTKADAGGGTKGNYDNTTDHVAVPALPDSYTVGTCGLLTIYEMAPSVARIVADNIWNDNIFDSLVNKFNSITDAIVSFGTIPYSFTDVGNWRPFKIAGKQLKTGNNDLYTFTIPQYVSVNLGDIDLNLYWDTALDYTPYTKLNIYLPFIGERSLNADFYMDTNVELIYHIDTLTGNCIAYITANGELIDQFTGNCMTQVPLNGANYSNIYAGIVSSLISAAPAALSGNIGGAIADVGLGVASTAINSKVQRDQIGSVSSSFSRLVNLRPHIEIIRPIQQLPRNFERFEGYPANITAVLSMLSGYTEVESIHLDNVTCTEVERAELEQLLKGGVIL